MDRTTKVALASAVLGGYVLGRTKKGRLALTVATFLAGKGLGVDPKQLVTDGVRRLGEIPQVAELQEQVRDEGLDAARGALSAVVDRGVGSLGDSISGRAANLAGKREEPDETEEQEEGVEEPEDEYEDEESEEETEEEPPSGRRRGRKSDELRRKQRQQGRATGKTASRAAKKPAAGKGAPARREAKKSLSARKRAAGTSTTRNSRRR
ncbi:histone protein [Streptomyces sp. GMY02]|uniref:histone protein n=1 Tax=Streptomyces sp. GMY02 TaxID=1333528 RepID=UPI001C2BDA3B|nr:histone protein [Streptomyces sp. GMY02]QXE37983.1 histone protein [Streptomyces sp. GMY02]